MNFEKISKRELYREITSQKERVCKLLMIVEMQAQKLNEICPNNENEEHLLSIKEIKEKYGM